MTASSDFGAYAPLISAASQRQRCYHRQANHVKIKLPVIAVSIVYFVLVSNNMISGVSSFSTSPMTSSSTMCSVVETEQYTPLPYNALMFSSKKIGSSTRLYNFIDFDDDEFDKDENEENYDYAVAAQVAKAKRLLKDAREKIEKNKAALESSSDVGETENSSRNPLQNLPFFAAKPSTDSSKKIKKKTSSGIVADGEKMATLSTSEEWERRSLSQLFRDEITDETTSASKALAERDLAAQIYNLRKTLQNDDFKKVFDSKNRWIGELD